MDTNEAGNDESSNPTRNVEAAVISKENDGNNDSATVDAAEIISEEDGTVKDSEEMTSPEIQETDAKQGEMETDVTANDEETAQESNDDANSPAVSTPNVEEAKEEHTENEVDANSADVDLLGFTDEGATEIITDEAEILSSSHEKDNTEKTSSNSCDMEEVVQENNDDVDTAAATPIQEDTVETGVETKSNDVDLLGFIDEGAGEIVASTTSQAEIAQSFPENDNIAGAVSNDFNLLGFADDKPKEDQVLIGNDISVDKKNDEETDLGGDDVEKNELQEDEVLIGNDISIDEQNDDEETDLGEEGGENNVPEIVDNAHNGSEVATETNQVPIQGDLLENNALNLTMEKDNANENEMIDAESKEIDPVQRETIEATNPNVEKNDEEETDLGGEGGEKNVPEIVDNAHNGSEAATETNQVPIQGDLLENNALNLTMEKDNANENEMIDAESKEIDPLQKETMEATNPNVPNVTCETENVSSPSQNEPRTISEPTDDGDDDQDDSSHLNTVDMINSNADSLEAKEDNPKAVESLPSIVSNSEIEGGATEETETSNDENCINDSINGDSIQTNPETETPSSPPDEPSATIVALPEDNFSVSNENTTQSVETDDDEVVPAAKCETINVDNTTMQENTKQAEEDIDRVQLVEEESGTDIITTQNEETENITEEEAEWLSMGLTLGDALRQIVALTDERDSAIAICQEKDAMATQAESLLVEVQSRLESEMNRRAESDSKARKLLETMKAYEARLEAFEKMEDELEATQANLVSTVAEKSKLEIEITKLREVRDESERKEAVLSNRLNEAKKKEANKSNTAGRLELDNEELRANLESTKAELETVSKSKSKLESTMEKLKTKAVERVKQAETALKEERELNEERKKKMKLFVETKAEELREAKESAGDMQKELQETRTSLTASRDREESIQNELESARIKYREVLRDMERMKRNAEALHNMGSNLEQELEKSANETEEHKKKRISAKHELMTMMRTLEVEKGVSEKLRESMKFTFAPKAQSQQQLLSECLRDLEQELDRLSIKLGKPLLPHHQEDNSSELSKNDGGLERSPSNGSAKKARRGRANKADLDTERLISNLEQETQHVSKGIMALVSSIERMRLLLDEDNPFNCMAFLSNQFGLAIGTEARHQRLGDETPADDGEESMSITSFEQK